MSLNSPIFDLHCDAVLKLFHRNAHFVTDNAASHVDIPKMKKGTVNGMFYSLWSDPVFNGDEAVKRTRLMLTTAKAELEKCKNDILFSTNSKDLDTALEQGKINGFFGIEGGKSINNSLENLKHFYALGVRRMTLTHTISTDWAGSATDSDKDKGLSSFGKDVVHLMNELGMVVDVAHTNERTSLDAVKVSIKPVFCTHGGARKVFDADRLATDETIKAIGESGGIFGVTMMPNYFIGTNEEVNKKWTEELIEKLNSSKNEKGSPDKVAHKNASVFFDTPPPSEVASIEGVIPHFDHVIDLIGEDQVGIGTDFDGMPFGPKGLEHAGKLDNLRNAMRKHGYSEQRIRKICGENVRRVLKEILPIS